MTLIERINALGTRIGNYLRDSVVPKLPKKYLLTAAVTSNSTTRANVPGWSFPVTAGKDYRIEIIASFQTALTTTGGSMGFVLTGSPTSATGNATGYMEAEIVQTAGATGVKQSIRTINNSATTAGSFMTSPSVGVANSNHSWYALVLFDCTASGFFNVQWGSEVAGSNAVLSENSVLLVTEI